MWERSQGCKDKPFRSRKADYISYILGVTVKSTIVDVYCLMSQIYCILISLNDFNTNFTLCHQFLESSVLLAVDENLSHRQTPAVQCTVKGQVWNIFRHDCRES